MTKRTFDTSGSRARLRPRADVGAGDRERRAGEADLRADPDPPDVFGLPASTVSRLKGFIGERMPLAPAPGLPDIRLHTARPESGLGRFLATLDHDRPVGAGDGPDVIGAEVGAAVEAGQGSAPYWAYPWAGGLALAAYLAQAGAGFVAGRRVLDLGTGSGLVAIAAARAGASRVSAVDCDPLAAVAAMLNVRANGLAGAVTVECADPLAACRPPVDVDCILVGDLFYEEGLAERVLRYLAACRKAGLDVLVGDPFRVPLPATRLERIATIAVSDVGRTAADRPIPAGIFRLRA